MAHYQTVTLHHSHHSIGQAFYRQLQNHSVFLHWSPKMHHSIVLSAMRLGMFKPSTCFIKKNKKNALLSPFQCDIASSLSKQPCRIKSGSIYFEDIFSFWPPAWITPAMLTSWSRAIFTEGWASIISSANDRQAASEEGKVWSISHHSPILVFIYLKHLAVGPQQRRRSNRSIGPPV